MWFQVPATAKYATFMQEVTFPSDCMKTVSLSELFLEAAGNPNLSLICMDWTNNMSSLVVERLLRDVSVLLRFLPNEITDRSSPKERRKKHNNDHNIGKKKLQNWWKTYQSYLRNCIELVHKLARMVLLRHGIEQLQKKEIWMHRNEIVNSERLKSNFFFFKFPGF